MSEKIDEWVEGLTPAARETLSRNDIAALKILFEDAASVTVRPRNDFPLGKTMRLVVDSMEVGVVYGTYDIAKKIDRTAGQITTTLGRLADRGVITCIKRGKWCKEVDYDGLK
jgi:hypothetical protein